MDRGRARAALPTVRHPAEALSVTCASTVLAGLRIRRLLRRLVRRRAALRRRHRLQPARLPDRISPARSPPRGGVDLRPPRSGTRAVRGHVRAPRTHPSGASCARADGSATGRRGDDGQRAVRRACPWPRPRSSRATCSSSSPAPIRRASTGSSHARSCGAGTALGRSGSGRMSRKENLPLLLDAADEIVNAQRRDGRSASRSSDAATCAESCKRRSTTRAERRRRSCRARPTTSMVRDWLSTADICVSLDERNADERPLR